MRVRGQYHCCHYAEMEWAEQMNLGHIMRPRVTEENDLHLIKAFQRPAKSRLVNKE